MTDKVEMLEKELTRDVSAFGPKKVSKIAGDIVKVSAHVVADNPALFADVGSAKRRIKSSGDTVKLKARIDELEAQNKALLSQIQKLRPAK
jgi:hypothetical protein